MYAVAEELLIHLTTAKSQGGLGVARSRVVLLGQSIGVPRTACAGTVPPMRYAICDL